MGTLGALRGEEGARQRMGGEGGWGEPGHAGRGRRLGGQIPRGAPGKLLLDFLFLCLFFYILYIVTLVRFQSWVVSKIYLPIMCAGKLRVEQQPLLKPGYIQKLLESYLSFGGHSNWIRGVCQKNPEKVWSFAKPPRTPHFFCWTMHL